MLERLFCKSFLTKKWVRGLDLKDQSTLVTILRGDDSYNGGNIKSKNITKMLRYLVVNNIGKKNSYMSDAVMTSGYIMTHLLKSREYNMHWVEHVIAAAFVIKNKHPNNYTGAFWGHIADGYIYRVKAYKKKQEKIEAERKRIIDKYIDIYTNRDI